ncbi:hypothetical protein predicted by Glimmer/Critica [Acetobacter ghanensis]|uniref:Uncharacterized protein n=1 Tax=Acetobacter ghanensis TaxID=431306 RepID=A0A0U4YA97_9PROT|nr:hypothetical protein predicted by Glimmer/Critica [Acetobacter ghanensis]
MRWYVGLYNDVFSLATGISEKNAKNRIFSNVLLGLSAKMCACWPCYPKR